MIKEKSKKGTAECTLRFPLLTVQEHHSRTRKARDLPETLPHSSMTIFLVMV